MKTGFLILFHLYKDLWALLAVVISRAKNEKGLVVLVALSTPFLRITTVRISGGPASVMHIAQLIKTGLVQCSSRAPHSFWDCEVKIRWGSLSCAFGGQRNEDRCRERGAPSDSFRGASTRLCRFCLRLGGFGDKIDAVSGEGV